MAKLSPIYYIDRLTQERFQEKVYGDKALALLYGSGWLSLLIGPVLRWIVSRVTLFSCIYGWMQRLPSSRRKIEPFIHTYAVDVSEFSHPVSSFRSFNDFFIRTLKPECRPIAPQEQVAIIPADGRYLFFPHIEERQQWGVKGKSLSLGELLDSESLARRYVGGCLVLARLCPTDYHRFHFPCSGRASQTTLINGWLSSVNPVALKHNIKILSQNRRTRSTLSTDQFGEVILMEVGATNVGSITQVYLPQSFVHKGREKGYFSFGGSALILLFEPQRLIVAPDLLALAQNGLEILCLMGQPLGTACRK